MCKAYQLFFKKNVRLFHFETAIWLFLSQGSILELLISSRSNVFVLVSQNTYWEIDIG
mgnify:CR=1 FL=1